MTYYKTNNNNPKIKGKKITLQSLSMIEQKKKEKLPHDDMSACIVNMGVAPLLFNIYMIWLSKTKQYRGNGE